MTESSSSTRAPPPPTWLERNWKWLVPALVLVCLGCVASFIAAIIGFLRQSEPYVLAVAEVRASPAALETMGAPVTEGFFVKGNIHLSNAAGQAQFEIPVSGPKAKGVIYVEATRKAGKWNFEHLSLVVDSPHQLINLLPKEPAEKKPD